MRGGSGAMGDHDRSMRHRFHHAKGRLLRALGWLTADRHVEAEGVAELAVDRRPDEREVERAEHQVHVRYGESDTRAQQARSTHS